MRAAWRRWTTLARGCCSLRDGTRRPRGPRVRPCVRSKRGTGRPSFPKLSPRTALRWRARGSTRVRALKDAGGVVTRAAQLLGFKHHNSLISRINKRHTNLLQARSPVLPRKRSIIRDPDSQHQPPESDETGAVSILHVEDDRQVADALRDTLEDEGWRVE